MDTLERLGKLAAAFPLKLQDPYSLGSQYGIFLHLVKTFQVCEVKVKLKYQYETDPKKQILMKVRAHGQLMSKR